MKDRLQRRHRDGHRSHVSSPERYAAGMKDKLVHRTNKLSESLKQERGNVKMLNLNALRNFDPDRLEIDELVALSAGAQALVGEYNRLSIMAPEWIGEQVVVLDREIKRRLADDRARRLKELKSRRAALATADEKRKALDDKIAELEAVQ